MNEEIEFEENAKWLVIFITVIGGMLRAFLIGNKGMWLDETFSIWLASHNVADMLQWIVKIDQHPPLYYLLLHFWIAIGGDKAGSVRLLSALFGTATIPVIYLIGKRLSGVAMGLAAAIFLAVSPFNIYYGQETRMYTLLTFNASVAIYALVKLLTDPHSREPIGSQFRANLLGRHSPAPIDPEAEEEFSYEDKSRNRTWWRAWINRHRWPQLQAIETDLAWVTFIVFSAATLLSHNTAVLFVAATNIFVLGLMYFQRMKKSGSDATFQAPTLGNWVKAQIGIFLLWSPWISAFVQQTGRVYQEFWIPQPTWDTVIQTLRSFLNASGPVPPNPVIMALYILVLCLGLVHFRNNISRFLFLAALFAVPVLGELIVSIRRPIFYDRTLIWITIPLFLVMAAGIVQVRYRIPIIVVLGILATNNLFSAADYYRFYQKEDWTNAAREVVGYVEKDDLILFNASWVQIPFEYYVKTLDQDSILMEKFRQAEEHGVPSDMFDQGILEPKMTTSDVPALVAMLRGHSRVWLVYSHNSYTDPMGLIPQTLASQMKLIRESDYNGVQVRLYGTP